MSSTRWWGVAVHTRGRRWPGCHTLQTPSVQVISCSTGTNRYQHMLLGPPERHGHGDVITLFIHTYSMFSRSNTIFFLTSFQTIYQARWILLQKVTCRAKETINNSHILILTRIDYTHSVISVWWFNSFSQNFFNHWHLTNNLLQIFQHCKFHVTDGCRGVWPGGGSVWRGSPEVGDTWSLPVDGGPCLLRHRSCDRVRLHHCSPEGGREQQETRPVRI